MKIDSSGLRVPSGAMNICCRNRRTKQADIRTKTEVVFHMGASEPVEQAQAGGIRLWLDSQEALERFQADIDHFAALDPNIAWVQEALMARFEELPEEDAIRVITPMWPQFKAMLMPDICPSPGYPYHPPVHHRMALQPSVLPWFGALADGSVPRSLVALRHGLVEGEALRRRVEADLEGPLAADALRNTAKEIKEWEHTSGSAHTREFDVARDELERMVTGPERKWGLIAVAVVFGGVAGYLIAQGYVLSHPI
ncbi:hypothetical protein [Streptomyces coffeae]|uniref:DUF445 family protein n=1 Tax=Streptomyces coffeae TaxID=621382 RepID=A0ABS1NN54_9ACTN|nr:hypothetical protein [Streptomyces coffeae]MBL1101523.1 hypothetical protein [Streptomyces coffeae]